MLLNYVTLFLKVTGGLSFIPHYKQEASGCPSMTLELFLECCHLLA